MQGPPRRPRSTLWPRPCTPSLTAHELANRLSFHFWQAPPDSALRAAADDGILFYEHDPFVVASTVELDDRGRPQVGQRFT